MKSHHAENMCLVRVALEPPETKIAIMTSSKKVKNDNNDEVITENLIHSKVMVTITSGADPEHDCDRISGSETGGARLQDCLSKLITIKSGDLTPRK